jgi:HTH-type transcriptional regulator/antitoxin HipB
MLRRIRRVADLSQRELAREVDVSKSAIAAAETGVAGLDVRVVAHAATVAGLRLALVDAEGAEIPGMSSEAVRDLGGRRFPAHLDPARTPIGWWEGREREGREQPWFTFDRDRINRDRGRSLNGTPADHQLPEWDDSPAVREEARRVERRRQQDAERKRAFLAGEFRLLPDPFECTCPPECEELEDWSGPPVHAEHCPCRCDVD